MENSMADAKEKAVFKKGQTVTVTNRGKAPINGTVVAVIPGPRGDFVEVDHGGEIGPKRYRPAAIALA
jgi:hypothetical protein